MNLQQFINYRQCCPLCSGELTIEFHSARKQKVLQKERRLLVFFGLNGRTNRTFDKPYAVAYSFNLDNREFEIDFYDAHNYDTPFTIVHDFLRQRFWELHKNLKQFNFSRRCYDCGKYHYTSDPFDMDLKTTICPQLTVRSEYFGLTYLLNNSEYRIFRLFNDYGDRLSSLTIFNGSTMLAEVHHGPADNKFDHIRLPLIPFVSKEQTLNRLKNLIIFT